MIEIDTSILISAIALIVSFIFSFTSFYYLQLQGAKFRIEHISKNLQPNSTYEHIITIVNIGNHQYMKNHPMQLLQLGQKSQL